MPYSLGFVGVGTINSSIVKGLCRLKDGAEVEFSFPLYVSPRGTDKVKELLTEFGPSKIHICDSNEAVVQTADVLVLGMTPTTGADVLPTLAGAIRGDHIVINLLSTLTNEVCKGLLGGAVEVCKAVPLPPVAHHVGTTVISPTNETAKALFDHLGSTVCVEKEEQLRALQAATAMMGPMYATCRALQQWLQEKGVPGDAAAAFSGSFHSCINHDSALYGAQHGDKAFDMLIAEQTPGGLNEQAVKLLTERGVYTAQKEVLENIHDRIAAAGQKKEE